MMIDKIYVPENTGIAMQIGIANVAEYAYLLEPNWQDFMHGRVPKLKHVPAQFETMDEWIFIGIDSDVSSISLCSLFGQHRNAHWVSAHVVGTQIGLHKLASFGHMHMGVPGFDKGRPYTFYTCGITLSALIRKLGLTRLDVLALDVEGMEVDIFEHYDWHLKPTYISIEFHTCYPDLIGNITPQAFINIFENQGYKLIHQEKTHIHPSDSDYFNLEVQFIR